MNFLERLEVLLKEKGVSATKMSLDLGFSKDAVFNWKKRGTIPSGEMLAKVADYFGVSVDYLLGRSDNPSPVGEIFAASSKDEDFYGNLSEEGRRELDEYKQYLLQKYGKK
ncbi:helix-turn-helix domain-containing protein [Christensenella hongkongensis]|uniref:Transcriptional regulator, Cro/CI family n=1 Tax=Christensenella hongkongensis TaxID=270498 RepID=A0A0M2NLS9_9FIRM|nr:helix-turn-helix transcriptional regulator [Christensenella hongkongensis]KKI51205.1 transcriptional regulator, Cro/CI family [Christensenella hongkongensis]TCW30394.1 helix-turn-helix protein [Christensenella hongkongensis]